ncbi:VTT domain-containing protein [Achromobacter sp. GG226]|uniref:TVP38/TMEM64 family protein n=1 Tax=Verticiella alkaliphila TaxID=2779529 RepID=UPI001C0D2572|nr:VTT domain-containing protein [Verticiella sp. GG226]MBU4609306.1 VTT domain-containing protein [Verticiella sp. GG226]
MAVDLSPGRSPARPWLLPLVAALVLAAVVAGIWLLTPLRDHLTVDDFVAAADALEDMPFAPLIVIAVYVIGPFLLVPLTVTVAATGAIFGAWPGLAYAFVGSMLAAYLSFLVGSLVGGRNLRRIAGARVDALSRKVASKGVRAVLAVRLVPVAPFVVVNLVAGASAIRLRDYMLGTMLGMLPGILIKVVFVDQLAQAAETSDMDALGKLAIAAVVLVLLGVVVRRALRRRAARRDDD